MGANGRGERRRGGGTTLALSLSLCPSLFYSSCVERWRARREQSALEGRGVASRERKRRNEGKTKTKVERKTRRRKRRNVVENEERRKMMVGLYTAESLLLLFIVFFFLFFLFSCISFFSFYEISSHLFAYHCHPLFFFPRSIPTNVASFVESPR